MQSARVSEYIGNIVDWARQQPDISGVLLVGSYARGNARCDSDIDLCLFTFQVDKYLLDHHWLVAFGTVSCVEPEDWGAVKTLRTYFEDGQEVEFNFAEIGWASSDPVDPGTRQVVSDGARVLYDPSGALDRLLKAVL